MKRVCALITTGDWQICRDNLNTPTQGSTARLAKGNFGCILKMRIHLQHDPDRKLLRWEPTAVSATLVPRRGRGSPSKAQAAFKNTAK